MITLALVGVVGLVPGFVFGVLFERRNTQKVEAALSLVKALAAKAGINV